MNSDSFARDLSVIIFIVLLVAVPLAYLMSLILLRLYRRAVLRGMLKRTDAERKKSASQENVSVPHQHVQTELNINVHDSRATLKSSTEGIFADLRRAPWQAATIYAVAGLFYALVMTIIFLSATDNRFHIPSFLMIFWYYAWPVVVTVCLVAAANWQMRFMITLTYFLFLIPLFLLTLFARPVIGWGQIAVLWILTNLIALVVLLAFLNRRIRAVGPLVLTFMIIAVTGSVILPIFIGINSLFVMMIGFVLFGIIGWLLIQWIGDLYKQKKISEQSITIDAIWLLFGVFQSIGLIFEGERWFVASLLAFIVYKIVSSAGFSYFGYQASTSMQHPRLLLLRVFSLGRRSERLFDILGIFWRYVGSIRLIAGPDLATATMEPHEFLDFLSGKLSRRFIDTSQTLDLRISEMDNQPDRDGQFRVNDFFCYDSTWKMVLSRLVSSSDVVLMDLRGFSSQNAGCIFEINELINTVKLGQIIFVIDETTDEKFLRQVLQQAWDGMPLTSPNHLASSGLLQLFRLQGFSNRDLKQFLHRLAANATQKAQAIVQ